VLTHDSTVADLRHRPLKLRVDLQMYQAQFRLSSSAVCGGVQRSLSVKALSSRHASHGAVTA
jgi:hypothetical protein